MEIYAGLVLGFIGSLHCLGMCGPLIIALPNSHNNKMKLVIENLLYNFGRIFTYSVLGGILGMIGQSLPLAGYQQKISLILGILILFIYFFKSKLNGIVNKVGFLSKFSIKFKFLFGKILQSNGLFNKFIIGLFNGLLPCGLVYVALASSIAFADFAKGSIYMFLFGIGTLPMMFSVYLFRSFVSLKFKNQLRRIVPLAVVFLSLLLIFRGLSLGIPYISPNLPKQVETKQELKNNGGEELAPCCR